MYFFSFWTECYNIIGTYVFIVYTQKRTTYRINNLTGIEQSLSWDSNKDD